MTEGDYHFTTHPDGIRVTTPEGDSIDMPGAAEDEVWTIIGRYDDEHGTDFWDLMTEDNTVMDGSSDELLFSE